MNERKKEGNEEIKILNFKRKKEKKKERRKEERKKERKP